MVDIDEFNPHSIQLPIVFDLQQLSISHIFCQQNNII